MAVDTPKDGETGTPQAPSNAPSTAPAPASDNKSAEAIEAAKKEAEQARIRANQLENEKKALEEKLAAEERKKLEEKEEFKQLYADVKAQLDERNAKDAEFERQAQLSAETDKVFKDYPENVVELAKTAGLKLSDDSEESVAALKEKLETFKSKVAPTATPKPGNPREPAPAVSDRAETMQRIRGGDKQALYGYIGELPAVKRMREIAEKGA
jgi:hypothetical protein